MQRTCLIAVDVQNDFLPGGALAVPNGDAVIHPLSLVAQEADLVIASRDWHPANHSSFKEQGGPWPPHCVQKTKGAKIHPTIRRLANYTVTKGVDADKEAYSAFEGATLRPYQPLEQLLKRAAITRVVVGGLALDYCVRFSALDANGLGFDTIVPLNCTKAITDQGAHETIVAFDRAGVKVVDYMAW